MSSTRGFGKLALFRIFEKNHDLYQHANKFYDSGMSIKSLLDDGKQIYLAMHNADYDFRKPKLPEGYEDQARTPVEMAEIHRYRMNVSAVLKKKKLSLEKYCLQLTL